MYYELNIKLHLATGLKHSSVDKIIPSEHTVLCKSFEHMPRNAVK